MVQESIIYGFDEFMDKLRKLSEVASGEAIKEAVRSGGMELSQEIKIHIERQGLVDTGNLFNSVGIQEENFGQAKAEVFVGPGDVPYARIYEYGGVIVPRRAKTLAWEDESGELAFAMRVEKKKRPYIRPALDEGRKRIIQAMKVNMERAIAEAVR